LALVLGIALSAPSLHAQATGSIAGRVTDVTGGAIVGARVEARGPSRRRTETDASGAFRLPGLKPGRYALTVTMARFARFERSAVDVEPNDVAVVETVLELAPIEEQVTIEDEQPLGLDARDSAGTLVIKGEDLDALPDDPDEMQEALLALAGAAAGPEGGQIYIDGFSGGRMPSKESIREIRINASPFSAEFDRLGWGRIEILTKPGTDTFRGDVGFRFNDESLNSRNPFAPNRPPYQERSWRGNLSGPLVAKRASFFLDVDRRDTHDNDLINATLLDPSLDATPYALAVETPQSRMRVSPRIDLQLGSRHTLTVRYGYSDSDNPLSGIGGFSLPSRAYESSRGEHEIQIGETTVLSKSIANETRLQYSWSESRQTAAGNDPALEVLDAFEAGGAQVGRSSDTQKQLEIHNITSWTAGRHTVRGGIRVRGLRTDDVSERNFGGSVTFTGGDAPELDESGQIVADATGAPIMTSIDSLERFRRTLFLQGLGLGASDIRARGGGASQLRIAGGDPETSVRRWDVAPFVQDDWRVSDNVMLSLGLRYENQTLISSDWNLAPRLAFAWAPRKGQDGRMRTVVRGGFGIFYDRVSESLSLQALRYDGLHQRQYVVSDPGALDQMAFSLDGVSGVPSVETLSGYEVPQAIRRVAADIQAPITYQSSLSAEQMLPGGFTFSAILVATNSRRLLRSRNLNAPLPGGEHPLGTSETVYQYESTGKSNQTQLILGLNNRMSRSVGLFARYFLGRTRSDTDGAGSFPADPYDLAAEYGTDARDVRHRFILGGHLRLPGDVQISPFVIASSASPYNITIGRDVNGDTVFTDRPAYATDPTKPGLVETEYGLLDPNPEPGATLIPRNLGRGPGFFVLNLRLNKTFVFGRRKPEEPQGEEGGNLTLEGGRHGPPRGRGHRGGGPGHRHPGEGEGRATLSIGLSVHNLFNHVNAGAPVGNLTSPLFGQSLSSAGGFGRGPGGRSSSAGNRRIILQTRLGF